ncbi:MAG: efflux RND transporter periplasmic adaptor subunit [Rhodocyclaceae bacterium]|nr:efflux RND transporter periplasmic adaptor subunit [Rhodocyclaceae bacterium]
MPRRHVVLALSLAGLVALGAAAWYLQRAPRGGPPAAAPSGAAGSGEVMVEARPVVLQAMPEEVSAVGTLVSNQSVILRPEVAGRVARIGFREGAPVAAGTILVELDAAVQKAELQQAAASLSLAEANFQRTEDLFARKFVSHSARDSAASQLEVARAATALAQARFEKTRIRAPFAGVVGIRKVNVGDYIKEGEALVNIEEMDVLKVDFRLPELYLQRLARGQGLEVGSDARPGEVFSATVEAIDPLVDAQGRAVVLRARLPNHDLRLRPGMFARVRLILQARPAVAVIPEEALVPGPGKTQYVYRLQDGVARRVEVATGVRRAAVVEVTGGLAEGDQVVTAGQLKLRDGAAVKVAPAGGSVN